MSGLSLFASLGDQDESPLVENLYVYPDVYNINPSLVYPVAGTQIPSLLTYWPLHIEVPDACSPTPTTGTQTSSLSGTRTHM